MFFLKPRGLFWWKIHDFPYHVSNRFCMKKILFIDFLSVFEYLRKFFDALIIHWKHEVGELKKTGSGNREKLKRFLGLTWKSGFVLEFSLQTFLRHLKLLKALRRSRIHIKVTRMDPGFTAFPLFPRLYTYSSNINLLSPQIPKPTAHSQKFFCSTKLYMQFVHIKLKI